MKHETIKLNPLLQRLARTPLKLIIVLYTLLVAWFYFEDIGKVSGKVMVVFTGVGLFIWTLTEYVIHRFVFHGKSEKYQLRLFRYFLHGYHHERPTDPDRLVLPLIITLPITFFNYFLVTSVFGLAGSLVAGFTLGYIIYDITHYFIHQGHPKSRLGRYLKSYHFYHHFKDSHTCFGVTSPLWDQPFKTTRSPLRT